MKPGKKSKCNLGVFESKLGNAINEQLSIPCACNELTGELLRGVRAHAPHLTKVPLLASLQNALNILNFRWSKAQRMRLCPASLRDVQEYILHTCRCAQKMEM